MAEINEQDRAELVAYLDGELDEQASQAFEARLTRDKQLRGEAEALKKTWELLDYLPKAEPSTSFTHRTLERLQVKTTGLAAAGKGRYLKWLKPVSWAAAILVAMTGGLLLAHYLWPYASQPTQPDFQGDVEAQINEHRDVILNKRHYENGHSISFLRELAQEFPDEDDES